LDVVFVDKRMPLKIENRSITLAFLVTIVTGVIFLFLFLFIGINHRRDVYNDSKKLAVEISRKAAFETQVYLSSAISNAKFLEQKVQMLRKLNAPRKEISDMLMSAIMGNTNYLGTWSLWEPNAFDGKDYLYKEDSLYNVDGTVGVGYFRYNDTIYYEKMTSADYRGSYFLSVKESRKEMLTEPYRFVYSGYKQVFFGTSVSVPIIDDNKFLGAIGLDIDLKGLQKELNKIRPYETGYLSLISNNGTIITHIDSSLVNKNISNLLKPDDDLSYNSIVNGQELTFETMSEFIGVEVFRLFYPIHIGDGNKPWSMMIEIPLKKATARSRELLIVAIIMLFVGLSLLIYLIINIAERKRYEKDLVTAKNRTEESDRLKTAFLNNISHEIRTPLNGILGFTELLVESDDNDDEKNSYKDIIQRSSDQLLSSISNVMELSKIQARQLEVKIHDFEIEQALNNIVSTYNPVSKEGNLKFITSFPKNGKKYNILTDESKFMQILSYLLNNAFKFTKEGYIELGYKVKQNDYLIYVKDTGIGVNPENAESIFNYFTQENFSSTRNYGGLGVGLSISKSFVDMLGGSIWLESEVGKGSTFYFNLPKIYSKV